jgi:DNA-binding FadR family transcriptional regulator
VARLHREIVDLLLDRMIEGRYPAGSLLPKEVSLRDELDVSRGTVREALRALEERRVVTVKHGLGATVRPPEEWNVLDSVVAAALARSRKRRAFLDEVAEYRRLLEEHAAGLAAERASETRRGAIRAAAEKLPDAEDMPAAVASLRQLIMAAAGNRSLVSTLRALDDVHGAAAAGSPDDYVALGRAVAAGDAPGARRAALNVSP